MTEHDMRALALNLAHSERTSEAPSWTIKKAEAYLAFLMARDGGPKQAPPPEAYSHMVDAHFAKKSASTMTSAEIQRAQDAQSYANALNPYATTYYKT